MKLSFKREYLLFILFLYIIFLLFQIKPKRADWEKKPIPIPKEESKEITRVTKDFSFTETRDEKTLFEIYAREVLAQKETLFFLKDVIMTFFTKEGKLTINCKEAKFNIENKDAEIKGNVEAEFPSGLKLWTENIFYQHSRGILEGNLSIYMQYGEYYGQCKNIEINIFRETFLLKELEIQSEKIFLQFLSAEGNFKIFNFFSREKAILIYHNEILTLEQFSIKNVNDKIFIKGKCLQGNLKIEENYTFYSEEFDGEFSRDGAKPLLFKFDKGVRVYQRKENLSIFSENCIIYFEEEKPSIISFNNSIEVAKDNDRIYCDVINAYYKENLLENVFFGDYVILCFNGWYISCDTMNYLEKNKTLLLKGRTYGSKGYLKTKSEWMKIEENGEKVNFGGGVEMEEIQKSIKIKSKECLYEEKQKRATFREKVFAWTEEYTLKTQRLELREEEIIAQGKSELSSLRRSENLYLKAEQITIKQREEKLYGLNSVFLQYEKYKLEGYFLQVYRKDGKIQRFLLTDQIKFYSEDSKQKGRGEILDIYPEEGLTILEGCPAILEDEIQGKIEANQMIILKEPPEIFILDEKKGKVIYKSKN